MVKVCSAEQTFLYNFQFAIFNFQSIFNVSMTKFSNLTTSFVFENFDLKIH